MVDLLLVSRQPRNRLFRVAGGRVDRRPQEEGVVVRARDELFGRAARESLIALQGELLGCVHDSA